MDKKINFDQDKIKLLQQYVPIVARVHGESHPEFHQVHDIFNLIIIKINDNNNDLSQDFSQLRSVTSNYSVPNDVCESYEIVYKTLSQLDETYKSVNICNNVRR